MEAPMKSTSNAYAPLLMLGAMIPMLLVSVLAPAVSDGNAAAIAAMVGLFLVQGAALVAMGVLLGNHLRQRKSGGGDA